MTGTNRAAPPDRSPLTATFSGPPGRVFLQEDGETWTVGRLLSLAAEVDRAVAGGPEGPVTVRSRSAALAIAALLGAWKKRRMPLLLDPASRIETAGFHAASGGGPVLTSPLDPEGEAEEAVLVRERRTAPLEATYPVEDEPEVAFFTSGSMGEPKRTVKRAYQLSRELASEPGWLRLPRPCTVLCLVPPFHILGYIYGLYLPAATGGRTTFLLRATPQTWLARMADLQPDLVVGVPSHYRLMNQILDGPPPAATFLSSGAPLPADVAGDFTRRTGRVIRQVYGSTETGGIATRHGEAPWVPLPGLEWRVEPDDSRLVIRSPWQDSPDAWRRTDDLARAAGEGFVLLGRADSVVKVGGRRFSTDEIVQAALAHSAVEQAHAVCYDRYGEAAIALFVTLAAGAHATAQDVRAHLVERLAAFKVPRTIRILEELPATGSGKVDAAALRSLVSTSEGP